MSGGQDGYRSFAVFAVKKEISEYLPHMPRCLETPARISPIPMRPSMRPMNCSGH